MKELQIELGNRKTNYEEFKYILQSTYSINLEDRRDEIETNDYYIKIYEDNNLVKTDRYEEIPEENKIENEIKTYETQGGKQYKVELAIKIKDREYVLSELEYNTQDTEEIKGIYNKEDFLEIQARGHYIVLADIDLRGNNITGQGFGGENLSFNGKIDFNGHKLIKDTNTKMQVFYEIGENASVENLVFEVYLDNNIEISNYRGFFYKNYGNISNFKVILQESINKPNMDIALFGQVNYGVIDNFIIEANASLYGTRTLTLGIFSNYGTIKNGYLYGENIKTIYGITGFDRDSAGLCVDNQNGIISNIYSLINVDVDGKISNNNVGNIISNNFSGTAENLYSVGHGENADLRYGPTIGMAKYNTNMISNIYYFEDITFSNTYNIKTTPLALGDSIFQSQILNTENKFNIKELVEAGYYPHLNWPECMPTQEYIQLPEVKDSDLPDILSTEIIEQKTDEAKVKFVVNNPYGETITEIKVKNLNCKIEGQTYNNGKSEVIVNLSNPIICVSQYYVQSITTKGANTSEYTRTFSDNERAINIELYREIYNIDDWKQMNKSATENYKLMNNIDFKNASNDIYINNFAGKLDGQGYKIFNIEIHDNYNGLFIGTFTGEIKNIFIENYTQNIKTWGNNAIIPVANNSAIIKNVHVSNINFNIINLSSNVQVGGISAYCINSKIEDSSVTNIKVIANNIDTYNIIAGGLVGILSGSSISNCFVQDIDMKFNNSVVDSVGGLVGQYVTSRTAMPIKCSYAEGNIENKTITGQIGGLVGYGYINGGKIENCISKVNIYTDYDVAGGIYGIGGGHIEISNNLILGNIYSSIKYGRAYSNKVVGNYTNTGFIFDNNYAYDRQLVNGYRTEELQGLTGLLSDDDLTSSKTYLEILKFDKIYDYTNVKNGIIPKLYNVEGTEILANQKDIYIADINSIEIEEIQTEKLDYDTFEARIVINNPKGFNISSLEIEDVEIITISKNTYQNDKTYITFKGKVKRFYDTYKLKSIKYKLNGEEKELNVQVRIDIQFYKEIYNYNDWQSIESGTYQNYKLMADIDFQGEKNINANITLARLETDGNMRTLKNISIGFETSNSGLIKQSSVLIENIIFESIEINNSGTGNRTGVIALNRADLKNCEFNNVNINADNISYVGCIGESSGGDIKNINLKAIEIKGKDYIGGLGGYIAGDNTDNITATDIDIIGSGIYIGGISGMNNNTSSKIIIKNAIISGNSRVGGVKGYGGIINSTVEEVEVKGQEEVGGVIGYGNNGGINNVSILNSKIEGIKIVGGLSGTSTNIQNCSVEHCTIEAESVNSENIGGVIGVISDRTIQSNSIKNITINSQGTNIGGIAGSLTNSTCMQNYIYGGKIEGSKNLGGLIGSMTSGEIQLNYIKLDIEGFLQNIGGIIGNLDNSNMTAAYGVSNIFTNYIAQSSIIGESNVGGFIGSIAKELYMPDTYYYSNYVQADVIGDNLNYSSLGIGSMPNQNQYLKDTYFYKYSTINGENPNRQNEIFIGEDKYISEPDLKIQEIYSSKLKWVTTNWDFSTLNNNKYPILSGKFLLEQEGIDIPIDAEHIVSDENTLNIQMQNVNENQEDPEQTFEYANKEIQTYSTYSVITSEDGSKVTRNAKLYVKDNNLYVVPSTLNSATATEESIVPIANNLILDSYNGKEYETVLGSDGKLYDLKETITYPENFVNADIESIGNNLNSDVKEVEVTYKNGDKIKFNYQTGKIISSSESETSAETGLFDYIKDKISEIGESSSDVSQELTNKYEGSKELQSKLEETSVEEAIEKQNASNSIKAENIVTATENNETNNSYKENKYISIYNEETGEYEIYNEEELLDTSKEEVVSENEKIEANNLSEYYASEGETKNTKMGIVWIVISIIGVGIILFVLGIRGRSLNPDKKK